MLNRLTPPKGARKGRQRVGRGEASKGKTCGKGHKGQKARSGGSVRPGFEGGQMPINRRLPHRGFSNYLFRVDYDIVNVASLACFDEGTEVTPELLAEKGLTRKSALVKVLGDGELTTKLTVKAHKFSASAKTKIEGAGGSVEALATKKRG